MKRLKGAYSEDVIGVIVITIFALALMAVIFFTLDSALGEHSVQDNFAVTTISDKGTHSVKVNKTYIKKYDIYYAEYLDRDSVPHDVWNELEIGDEVVVQKTETWGKWTGIHDVSYCPQPME